MKDWFESLAPRERLIVIAGGLLLVPILLWAIAWEPLATKVETLQTDVKNNHNLLVMMQQASTQLDQTNNNSDNDKQNSHISLINAVESTARQAGLRKSISNLDPQSDDKINLRMKDAVFDNLIVWQGRLEKEFSIRTTQLNISPTGKSGLVNARIQFAR